MTNSPLNRHGIERLSASSLNLWIDNPGLWTLRYLANVKDDTGPAMARGTAVEAGMLQTLHGKDYDALAAAQTTFDENMQGEISDDIEAERKLIPGMVKQCSEWKPTSKIIGSQLKIETWLDGVSVPVIGYLDFTFEDGLIVDLKTTKACPSKPRQDHARQVALYRKARDNAPGGLLYVTEKRHAYYPVEDDDAEKALAELHSAALSLERFLVRFPDPEDAIRALPMNTDHFKFSDKAKLKLVEMHL